MQRGPSSSWDVARHWDVTPEEMAMDDGGFYSETLGQEVVSEMLETILPWFHESTQSVRALSLGIAVWSVRGRCLCTVASHSVEQIPTQTRRRAGHGEGGQRLQHN